MASSVERMSLERSGALVWWRVQPFGSAPVLGMTNSTVRRTAQSPNTASGLLRSSSSPLTTASRHGFTFFEDSTRIVRPDLARPTAFFEPWGAGMPATNL